MDKVVLTEKLADSAVTDIKLADGSVVTGKISDLAVTGEKIANATITEIKLADGAVITAKVTDGAITEIKLADGSVSLSKLSGLMCLTGEILKKNGFNWECAPDIGSTGFVATITDGDGITNTGTATDPILNANTDNVTIEITSDTIQLKDGGVTSVKIADGTIVNDDVSALAGIEWSKIDKAGSNLTDIATRNLSDLINRLAQYVEITDTGNYFSATDTEGTLQEIGGNYFKNNGNSFGTSGIIGTNDNNRFEIETNGTTKLTVLPNGNVGIGTNNPQKNLTISTLSRPYLRLENTDQGFNYAGTSTWGEIQFYGKTFNANPSFIKASISAAYNVGDGNLVFSPSINGNNAEEKMRLTSTGLGIGTTSPQTGLHISGGLGSGSTIRLKNTGASNYWDIMPGVSGVSHDYLNILSSGSSKLVINGSGYVGIGTTNPIAKLTILDGNQTTNNDGSPTFMLQNSVNTNLKLYMGTNSTIGVDGSIFIQGVRSGYSYSIPILLAPQGGNVAIGTASPFGKLHSYVSNSAVTAVSYNGYFENLATNTTTDGINKYGLYVTSTGSFTGSGGTATNNYGIYVNTPTGADNNYAAVFTGGDVGIGTTSPQAKLNLSGTSAEGVLLSTNATASGNTLHANSPFLKFSGSIWGFNPGCCGPEKKDIMAQLAGINGQNERYKLSFSSSDFSEFLYFDGTSGNIVQNQSLDLIGDLSGPGIQRRWNLLVNNGYFRELGQWADGEGSIQLLITVSSKTSAHSGTNTYLIQGGYGKYSTNWSEVIPLYEGLGHGNGTTGFKLLVKRESSQVAYSIAVGIPSGLATKTLQITANELKGGMDFTDTSSAGQQIYSSESTFYSINNLIVGGNVGIGTNTPVSLFSAGSSSQFQVNSSGAIISATGIASSGTITLSSLTGCASGLQTDGSGIVSCLPSDVSLKNSVENISTPLQKILGLHGVSYKWNNPELYGAETEFGLIAQEVEQVAPELVFTMGNGLKGVKYNQLGALLLEGIKEQQSEISTLNSKIEELKAEFNAFGVDPVIPTSGGPAPVESSIPLTETLFTESEGFLTTEKGLKTLQKISSNGIVSQSAEDFVLELLNETGFKILSGRETLFAVNASGKINLKETPNGSTGQGVINAGETSVTIFNSSISSASRIFVSPDTFVTYKVSSKIPGISFTIEIETVQVTPVTFDYFIVN